MQLFVGRTSMRGDLARYKKNFDLLELRAEPGKTPRAQRLRQWRSEVGPEFSFAVMVPRALASLETAQPNDADLSFLQSVAGALEASFIVIQTPPSVTPSSRARQRLADLTTRLRAFGRPLAWEPRGLWEQPAAAELAAELDLVLVNDLCRDDAVPGEVVYTRLLALGEQSRLGAGTADIVAERLAGFERAYVVIEGEAAPRFARLLRDAVQDSGQFGDDGEEEPS